METPKKGGSKEALELGAVVSLSAGKGNKKAFIFN